MDVRTSGRRSRITPPSSAGEASPAKAARSSGCVTRRPGRSRSSMTAISPAGPLSMTATPRSIRLRCIAARSCWTGRRAASTSSTRSSGGSHDIRLAFHLGPDVQAELEESCAALNWPTASVPGAARLELPPGLRWSLHRGETDPILGWYAPGPGRRVPAFTLLGRGRCLPEMPLITRLEFFDAGRSAKSAVSRHAISWTASVALPDKAPEIRAEAR